MRRCFISRSRKENDCAWTLKGESGMIPTNRGITCLERLINRYGHAIIIQKQLRGVDRRSFS